MIRYSSNGSQITASENVTNYNISVGNNDTSIITYEHLDNPLWIGHSDLKHISRLHGIFMAVSYSQIYFILTQGPGDLLSIIEVNRSKSIGMRDQHR